MTQTHARFEVMEKTLQLLQEAGPQTRAEICEELRICDGHATAMMRSLRQHHCLVHISGWVYELGDGGRRYPRAQYAFGPGDDKPKPRVNRKAVRQRYRARRKLRVTSVFDLGLSLKQRPGCQSI